MAKFILFSKPREIVLQELKSHLFVNKSMSIAYMPSDGSHPSNPEYEAFWKDYIEGNGAKFIVVNNSLRGDKAKIEAQKLLSADAVILTGGNTFQFLSHLKESGLDKVILEFAQSNKTIAGFSAGAMVLSPTIEIAEMLKLDENLVGITDLSSLGLIDFDIFPHYEESKHKAIVDGYAEKTGRQVKRLTDEFIRSQRLAK